jgi:hypothetical protein
MRALRAPAIPAPGPYLLVLRGVPGQRATQSKRRRPAAANTRLIGRSPVGRGAPAAISVQPAASVHWRPVSGRLRPLRRTTQPEARYAPAMPDSTRIAPALPAALDRRRSRRVFHHPVTPTDRKGSQEVWRYSALVLEVCEAAVKRREFIL